MKQKVFVWGLLGLLLIGLAGCGKINGNKDEAKTVENKKVMVTEPTAAPKKKKDTLVVGSTNLTGKFNPLTGSGDFYSGDKTVADLVFASINKRGEKGELLDDLGHIDSEAIQNTDGTVQVKYTITIEPDLKFSDGKKLTIDDVLFTYYLCLDPSYEGEWELNQLPIVGQNAYYFDHTYYSNMVSQLEQKYRPASISKEDFINYLVESKLDGWFDGKLPGDADGNGMSWADYLEDQGYEASAIQTADEMLAMLADCEFSYHSSEYDPYEFYKKKEALAALQDGVSVERITGMEKVDETTCTILMDSPGSRDMELLGLLPILPEHYYGKNITKGNMEAMQELESKPLGCGPYRLNTYAGGMACLEINKEYYGEKPSSQKIEIQDVKSIVEEDPANDDAESNTSAQQQNSSVSETEGKDEGSRTEPALQEILSWIKNDTVDLYYTEGTEASYQAAGESQGVSVVKQDHAGYGYLGIQAKNVEDRNLRKGMMHLLQRDKAVAYYGEEMAEVLERPMDPTLYEYPEKSKEYYSYDKSKAEEYFLKAGYQKNGTELLKDGKKLVLHAGITSLEDHPGASVLTALQEDMKSLGGELLIDVMPYERLVSKVMDGELDLWFLAWEKAKDCNLTEMFGSEGENNLFSLASGDVDTALSETASAYDQKDRKKLVEQELDLIMDQAVCMPVYHRKDLYFVSTDSIQTDSVQPMPRGDWKFLAAVKFVEEG